MITKEVYSEHTGKERKRLVKRPRRTASLSGCSHTGVCGAARVTRGETAPSGSLGGWGWGWRRPHCGTGRSPVGRADRGVLPSVFRFYLGCGFIRANSEGDDIASGPPPVVLVTRSVLRIFESQLSEHLPITGEKDGLGNPTSSEVLPRGQEETLIHCGSGKTSSSRWTKASGLVTVPVWL